MNQIDHARVDAAAIARGATVLLEIVQARAIRLDGADSPAARRLDEALAAVAEARQAIMRAGR